MGLFLKSFEKKVHQRRIYLLIMQTNSKQFRFLLEKKRLVADKNLLFFPLAGIKVHNREPISM